jgi:hypothetical protein
LRVAKSCWPGQVRRRVQRLQQSTAIGPDRRRQRLTAYCRFGEVFVLDAGAIAVEPRQRHLGAQPIRGDHRQTIQGMAQGVARALQPVQDPNGRQDMGRVGALASTGLEQSACTQLGQQGVAQELFCMPGH